MKRKKTEIIDPLHKGKNHSVQLELFSNFVSNDDSEVSNTVEFWETIPKYFFTPEQVKKLRTKDGLAKSFLWRYEYKNLPYAVKIQPALIEKNGSEIAFFPGVTEELIEEALKKILSIQECGAHDSDRNETWIRFTLSMIQKELKTRGRSRSIQQIKHAIRIMSRCIITLYRNDNEEIWNGSILQDLVTVGRDDYLGDTNSHHVARLPLFISHAIDRLEYRQFNIQRLMSCDEQLTRWIYRRLIHRYTQASHTNDYHFMYSDLKLTSALLQQGSESNNRRKVLNALRELIKKNILTKYNADIRKVRNKIEDIKYTVSPSIDFIKEQKASNKRTSDSKDVLNNESKKITRR